MRRWYEGKMNAAFSAALYHGPMKNTTLLSHWVEVNVQRAVAEPYQRISRKHTGYRKVIASKIEERKKKMSVFFVTGKIFLT